MKSQKEIKKIMHEIAVEHCQTRQKPYISILQPRRNFKEFGYCKHYRIYI